MTVSAGNGKLKVLISSQRFPSPMDASKEIRTGNILSIGGSTGIEGDEAMAMEKTMVSAGVDTEPVRNGEHLAIADNPSQFAAEVVRLLRDMEARSRLENSAKSFVEKTFSWDAAAAAFADICRQVVRPDAGEQCRI